MASPRPARCPRCNSGRIAAIVYSRPGPGTKLSADLQTRRAVLSEREPTGNDPRWRCLECHLEWGHPYGLSGSSPAGEDLA